MTPLPDIAVVIPSHQRRALLVRVLAHLARQTPPDGTWEVVAVCDGCTDDSAAAARAAAQPGGPAAGLRLTAIDQPRSGAATARNRGAAATAAPRLLFLDDDMIADPGLVGVHLARLRRQPDAIVLGAMPVHPDSPPSFLTEGLARWSARRDARLSAAGAEIPVDEVLTGQMSMARATFARLGGFDVRFTAGGTFGGEDVEFGWRARRLGIPIVYERGAISAQIYAKTFSALCRNIRQAAAADALMSRTHPEMASHLPVGQVDAWPARERLVLRGSMRWPGAASFALRPLLAGLDLAGRAHRRGRVLEALHGLARAHLYGLGLLDAGNASGGAAAPTTS